MIEVCIFVAFLLGLFLGLLPNNEARFITLKKEEWICTKSEIVGDTFPKTEIATQWTKKGNI